MTAWSRDTRTGSMSVCLTPVSSLPGLRYSSWLLGSCPKCNGAVHGFNNKVVVLTIYRRFYPFSSEIFQSFEASNLTISPSLLSEGFADWEWRLKEMWEERWGIFVAKSESTFPVLNFPGKPGLVSSRLWEIKIPPPDWHGFIALLQFCFSL